MALIILTTTIDAPLETSFDLSRSIDLHKYAAGHTGEQAVDGVTSGLIGANQTVTWRARHFGLVLSLTSKITEFHPPSHFRDSMQSGAFKRFDHDHYFEWIDGKTVMTDHFDFNSPLGLLGQIVDSLLLKQYLTEFLVKRNATIKLVAESNPGDFLGC